MVQIGSDFADGEIAEMVVPEKSGFLFRRDEAP
jgi:hypothetical protein